MDFRYYTRNDSQVVVALVTSVFAEAESEVEGALVGKLTRDLVEKTDAHDLYGFVAVEEKQVVDSQIIGSILFSRLTFEDDLEAFILSPVAIHSDYQNQGIGQALIKHGLSELKKKGVSVVMTYGNPAFYQKVGFRSVSPKAIIPPYNLSRPQGWIGQCLSDDSIQELSGKCSCVEVLSNPKYW